MMNERIKNALGVVSIFAICAIAIATWHFANSYGRSVNFSAARNFTVFGEGRATGIPDIAKFSFSVITEGGMNLRDIQEQNTEKTNSAIAYLKTSGVEAKDIKTESYDISPRYRHFAPPRNGGFVGPPEIVGYTITQTVSVKVRDLAKAGELLSGTVREGANSVSQLSFEIDDLSELKNEARAQAIAEAKRKAENVASNAGFGLGSIISISVDEHNRPSPMQARQLTIEGREDIQISPRIEPGAEEIFVTASIQFEIR